ncbi:MAG: HAD family phosphatase, partial [Pseudomonadota bacterium]
MHDLVIFDCDGVLVDSEPASAACIVENLARHSLNISLADCAGFFLGGTMAGVMETARKLGADLPDDWLDEIYGEIYDRLRQGVLPIPGIPKLLDELDKASMPYCVASNGSVDKMRITLGQNDLFDRFEDRMLSAHDLGTAKPEPHMFLTAAARFGSARPVVIEDSANGAQAAQRAGMRCLGYVPEGGGQGLARFGAEIFD